MILEAVIVQTAIEIEIANVYLAIFNASNVH